MKKWESEMAKRHSGEWRSQGPKSTVRSVPQIVEITAVSGVVEEEYRRREADRGWRRAE